MKATHTPGPWILDGDVIQSPGRWVVAVVHRFPENDDTARPANARLIAAAPDLLALAKQYASECSECEGLGYHDDGERAPCPDCFDIRAVIDKAEGRA